MAFSATARSHSMQYELVKTKIASAPIPRMRYMLTIARIGSFCCWRGPVYTARPTGRLITTTSSESVAKMGSRSAAMTSASSVMKLTTTRVASRRRFKLNSHQKSQLSPYQLSSTRLVPRPSSVRIQPSKSAELATQMRDRMAVQDAFPDAASPPHELEKCHCRSCRRPSAEATCERHTRTVVASGGVALLSAGELDPRWPKRQGTTLSTATRCSPVAEMIAASICCICTSASAVSTLPTTLSPCRPPRGE
mmetsp:Transcript_15269/g.36580  ORF Transcript_15269/g.36580 Transcript_15269/m.36580 type:complete len:251 (+) Transcript_15269:2712-3464(+)